MIQRVADTVGFPYRYEPALDQYIHPAGFVVAAPDGSVSRYLLGVNPQPTELQNALADAAQGKAVGLLTRLLLICRGGTAHPRRPRPPRVPADAQPARSRNPATPAEPALGTKRRARTNPALILRFGAE